MQIADDSECFEARQSFITEAKASWESFSETGLHISLGEFADWADKVQSQPDASIPLCHK
jgi:hypothetical protein